MPSLLQWTVVEAYQSELDVSAQWANSDKNELSLTITLGPWKNPAAKTVTKKVNLSIKNPDSGTGNTYFANMLCLEGYDFNLDFTWDKPVIAQPDPQIKVSGWFAQLTNVRVGIEDVFLDVVVKDYDPL